MTIQLESVQGLIELKDEFTGTIGLAEAALSKFTKSSQESLTAVAEVGGLVTASFAAIAAATIALGVHGSDVNDVADTLDHFAGSAQKAEAIMATLREGTKGTIDNFTLAKDASHLLSAGVELTTEQFGTLSQAAFVLQNRGLGGTKEMLNLVSDALVTGRTRALAMAVGVVDVGDAEQKLADKLGVSKDLLSDAAKVEAKRTEVMNIMTKAVKDAGTQEKDFGEKLEAAKATVTNWVNELSSAVAKSEVFAKGLDAVQDAVSAAFGGNQKDNIQAVVHWIEQAVIAGSNFALGAVEAARVVNTVWSGIKVVILSVEGVISMAAAGVAKAVAGILDAAASLPGAGDGLKQMAAAAHETATQLDGMTQSFEDQAEEARKGVVGASDFDKTLDKLGGTIMNVQDAMIAASKATGQNNETVDIAAKNAKTIIDIQNQLTKAHEQRLLDEDKLWKIEQKSLIETSALWNDYFVLRAQNNGSSFDAQRAAVDKWFNDEVAKLDASDANYNEHYRALEAVAKEKLDAIGSDWDTVKDKSISALIEQRDAAYDTYSKMASSGNFFRADVDAQKAKVEELNNTIRAGGAAAQDAQRIAKEALEKQKADIDAVAAAAKKAADEMRRMGGSFDVTAQNFEKVFHDINTAGGANPVGTMNEADALRLAHMGYSLQEILAMIGNHQALGSNLPSPRGPRIPGFKEGGSVDIMVGEDGPEAMRVPLGTQVFPAAAMQQSGDNRSVLENHILVTLDGRAVHRSVARRIISDMKMTRKLSSAT